MVKHSCWSSSHHSLSPSNRKDKRGNGKKGMTSRWSRGKGAFLKSYTSHFTTHGIELYHVSDQAASNLDTWILSAENSITPNNINILLFRWRSLDKQISICVAGLIITHLSSRGCCFNINKTCSSNESYNACAINVNCNIMGWSQFWNELKAQQLVTVQHILWDPTYFEFLGAHV